MTPKLDDVDRKILELLSKDGRLSSAQIARAIGAISERSVRYRLDRLIAENVLRVRGIVNPHALGYSVVADVLIEADPAQVRELAAAIANLEQVTYVACLADGSDVSVQVVARDNNELFTFVTEVLGKFTGVQRLTTSIVPHVVKEPDSWQAPGSAFQPCGPVTPTQ